MGDKDHVTILHRMGLVCEVCNEQTRYDYEPCFKHEQNKLAAAKSEADGLRRERDEALEKCAIAEGWHNSAEVRAEQAEASLAAKEKELAEAKEADMRHARVCPQHKRNIDPWVRESALIAKSSECLQLAAKVERMQKTLHGVITWYEEIGVLSDMIDDVNATLFKIGYPTQAEKELEAMLEVVRLLRTHHELNHAPKNNSCHFGGGLMTFDCEERKALAALDEARKP